MGLCLPKTRFRLDEEIPVQVWIENVGPAPTRVCVQCQGLWAFTVEGPGARPLAVPGTPGLPGPEQFRALAPGGRASFTWLPSSPWNALVTRLVIPGTYWVRALYVLDDGTLPNGVRVPGAWAGRIEHRIALSVIGETADGSPLEEHPGMRVLALMRDRFRPWLARMSRSAPRAERSLYLRAADLDPSVAALGSYGADALRRLVLGGCRDLIGHQADLAADRRYDLMHVSVGRSFADYVSFTVVLDGPQVMYGCVRPERGPVP